MKKRYKQTSEKRPPVPRVLGKKQKCVGATLNQMTDAVLKGHSLVKAGRRRNPFYHHQKDCGRC